MGPDEGRAQYECRVAGSCARPAAASPGASGACGFHAASRPAAPRGSQFAGRMAASGCRAGVNTGGGEEQKRRRSRRGDSGDGEGREEQEAKRQSDGTAAGWRAEGEGGGTGSPSKSVWTGLEDRGHPAGAPGCRWTVRCGGCGGVRGEGRGELEGELEGEGELGGMMRGQVPKRSGCSSSGCAGTCPGCRARARLGAGWCRSRGADTTGAAVLQFGSPAGRGCGCVLVRLRRSLLQRRVPEETGWWQWRRTTAQGASG